MTRLSYRTVAANHFFLGELFELEELFGIQKKRVEMEPVQC